MRPKLPEFPSPTTEQLRAIYARSDQDVRNVVLEVIRLRQLVADADACRETIDKCWKAEGLGQLVALYEFRILMQTERSRMGFISEYKGKADEQPRDAGDDGGAATPA
ncbi:hypothetical protein [Paraburkholderia sp. SOS3]|uniref:hypothetical protein n=1 Tax=Paraburkholderia sp. SOS3 TaxID=1926494 RepID=UPI0009477692|nr:hypothetical protein [Paraburkholderia sp. SOS3]APR37885.1 hypothetical protein BTO02_20170 [Paraburkholderia sp. SOS3]APR40479.1 hypothetical protein BTO02_33595 [Paraburkholderia sp. SOS3]